jgi:hypothetical protein
MQSIFYILLKTKQQKVTIYGDRGVVLEGYDRVAAAVTAASISIKQR